MRTEEKREQNSRSAFSTGYRRVILIVFLISSAIITPVFFYIFATIKSCQSPNPQLQQFQVQRFRFALYQYSMPFFDPFERLR